MPLCKRCHKIVETIFLDLEPQIHGDFSTAQLVLRASLTELQLATFMKLKEIARSMC
jgi:hypothetical protein